MQLFIMSSVSLVLGVALAVTNQLQRKKIQALQAQVRQHPWENRRDDLRELTGQVTYHSQFSLN